MNGRIKKNFAIFQDIDSFLLVLDVFTDRNLDDVDIAKSTRKELAERDSHIVSLTSRATAIHCALPGKGIVEGYCSAASKTFQAPNSMTSPWTSSVTG